MDYDYERLRRILESPNLTVEEKLGRVKKWLRGSEAELRSCLVDIEDSGWQVSPRFKLIKALLNDPSPKQPKHRSVRVLLSQMGRKWSEL
jgi:HEPN domain-containing protein